MYIYTEVRLSTSCKMAWLGLVDTRLGLNTRVAVNTKFPIVLSSGPEKRFGVRRNLGLLCPLRFREDGRSQWLRRIGSREYHH